MAQRMLRFIDHGWAAMNGRERFATHFQTSLVIAVLRR
jgi:hypothetical protein